MADMKKVLEAVDMLLEGLGIEEETPSETTPEETPPEEKPEVAAAETTPEETPEDEKKKDEEMVSNSVKKALDPILNKVSKSETLMAEALNKIVKANADLVEKQKAQDDALGLLLEGFGLKDQVLKSYEDANKPEPGKATMEDVLLAINKSNETLAQAILGNQNGGGMQVQKSAPHSSTIMQSGFGKDAGQQSQSIDSVVNKDFVEGFGKILRFGGGAANG